MPISIYLFLSRTEQLPLKFSHCLNCVITSKFRYKKINWAIFFVFSLSISCCKNKPILHQKSLKINILIFLLIKIYIVETESLQLIRLNIPNFFILNMNIFLLHPPPYSFFRQSNWKLFLCAIQICSVNQSQTSIYIQHIKGGFISFRREKYGF